MRRAGLLVPDEPQATLAFAAPTLPPVNVKLLRGLVVCDSKAMAESVIARKGNLYYVGTRMTQVRPRETRHGWMLVSWFGGYPYALEREGGMRKMRASDL